MYLVETRQIKAVGYPGEVLTTQQIPWNEGFRLIAMERSFISVVLVISPSLALFFGLGPRYFELVSAARLAGIHWNMVCNT